MTFLTNLGLWEILCNSRLVLEEKAVKDSPEPSRLEFFKMLFWNNFTLSGAEDSTFRQLKRGGITNLALMRTLLAILPKSRKPSDWEVKESQLCIIFTGKFGNFKNSFATINSESVLYFRFTTFILSIQYKPKKGFLRVMAAAQSAENHGDEWVLAWRLRWGIYTSIPTCTHS